MGVSQSTFYDTLVRHENLRSFLRLIPLYRVTPYSI